ncbi:radical SAM protein [Pasteurella atlantica]|uniref:radical SAM protein n=1 Tax=Pasteurellaceae TaxID=712 RepID=UPI002778D040|nr:radical SAM protein [Pasteurella atlantica]MDP8034491.1 radical SAM protein [Pasteurella atlantica]MDP8036423.1 radical SAM protein [Pasteurella atlantica]MDP8038376.1 radical SAM protein [Pasteurella atlantica]MDP8048688.1 radical SAM protein [Pasteurella atlantica]MDP8050657.1 radical SAM protein [Pasteurella atlantica]
MQSKTQLLSEITLPLHRIIPFSNVEGVGNRTSIFLQGCKLNCLYCHNPETIPRYTDESKKVSLNYLFQQVMDAVPFIRGVTVSGGEPTIHHKKLVPLFNALKEQDLTCYLDSCGFFDFEKTKELIEVTDKFLFDLKGIGDGLQSLCFDRKNREGKVYPERIAITDHIKRSNLDRNLQNLEKLLKLNKIEEIRLVMINGFFDEKRLIKKVAELNPPKEVILKIIRVHNKGTRDPEGLAPYIPTTDEIDDLTNYAKQCGFEKVITIY